MEPAKERVRVHFLGWSSRHDRNYKHGSADIRLICTAEEAEAAAAAVAEVAAEMQT